MSRGESVERFLVDVRRQLSIPADARIDVFAFGDSPAMADELGRLVFAGPKRATASLLTALLATGEPVPQINDHSIVLDGRGQPMGVIRTTEVRFRLFLNVDDEFAAAEAEGDRTLASWRDAHRQFFTRQCASLGLEFDESRALIVCERFEVVVTNLNAGL